MKRLLTFAVAMLLTCSAVFAASPYRNGRLVSQAIVEAIAEDDEATGDELYEATIDWFIKQIDNVLEAACFFEGFESGLRAACAAQGVDDEDQVDDVVAYMYRAVVRGVVEEYSKTAGRGSSQVRGAAENYGGIMFYSLCLDNQEIAKTAIKEMVAYVRVKVTSKSSIVAFYNGFMDEFDRLCEAAAFDAEGAEDARAYVVQGMTLGLINELSGINDEESVFATGREFGSMVVFIGESNDVTDEQINAFSDSMATYVKTKIDSDDDIVAFINGFEVGIYDMCDSFGLDADKANEVYEQFQMTLIELYTSSHSAAQEA